MVLPINNTKLPGSMQLNTDTVNNFNETWSRLKFWNTGTQNLSKM